MATSIAQAAAQAAAEAAAEQLIQREEKWMTNFVHCDVKKDHGSGYNYDIVQGFLPAAAPYAENNVSKEDLFDVLIGGLGFYDFLRGVAFPGNRGYIAVNLFHNATYEYRLFSKNDFKKSHVVQQIQTATRGTLGLGTSFLKISDTTNHTDDIHKLWDNSADTGNPIIQARTRAVQMDAAFKMMPNKVGNDAMFYIEDKSPPNTTSVLYPSYYTENKLSYLYCKYPVYIKHNGVKADKYTLKVGLSYIKNNKSVDIDGDLNTAEFMFKIVEKIGGCFGMSSPDILEAGYIGKHSGDVLQVLDAFRDINLVHYTGNNTPYQHQAGAPSIFETIDINAASKAFSTGVYCIWLHMKDKLVVFTKVIDELSYLRNKYKNLYKAVEAKYSILPSIEATLESNKDELLEMIKGCNIQFETILSSTDSSYKKFLETCAKYSVFYEKLPLLHERINDLNEKLEKIRKLLQQRESVLTVNEAEDNKKIYLIVIEQLEEFIRLLDNNLNLDGELAAIRNLLGEMQTIEFNDIIISNEGTRKEITYGSAFDCIDLDVENGRSKRILADKFSSAYGLDIINMTYKKLSIELPGGESPSTKHTRFIEELYRRVGRDKQEIFISLLESIGIRLVSIGGSRKTLKKNKKGVRKTYKQTGGNQELINEIFNTIYFFTYIYKENNDEFLRTYINQRFNADITKNTVNIPQSNNSRVILNILETYKDMADNLKSDTLKDSLFFLETIDLFEIRRKPTLRGTRVIKGKKELNKFPKLLSNTKPPLKALIYKSRWDNPLGDNPLISPRQQAEAGLLSLRKTRKKLRE